MYYNIIYNIMYIYVLRFIIMYYNIIYNIMYIYVLRFIVFTKYYLAYLLLIITQTIHHF